MTERIRIAVHENPSLDALVAVWLALRYFFVDALAEVVFVPRRLPLYKVDGVVWRAEPDAVPLLELGWGRKQPSFAERYAASATGRLWAHLQSGGTPANHLVDLVDCVHADATGKKPADAPWYGLASRLRRMWKQATASCKPDHALSDAVSTWLDGYDRELRRYSTTPGHWEGLLAQIPEGPGTYALILRSVAPRAILVGRTGNLGRMVTQVGYYVYLGSALNGLRGRDRHHLTPAELLRAKWQVDSLRLVTTVEEIWYTASEHQWECDWAKCMLTLPGAEVTAPRKFGATNCKGKCVTHLPYFAEKPSLEVFRSKVGAVRYGGGCRVERLAVSGAD